MGFLGFGKKKEKDPLQALEELNLGDDMSQQNPYLQDQNSMNSGMQQNPNFSQDNSGMQDASTQRFDSFGNPMRDPYDSQAQQQMYNQSPSQSQGTDSRDIQLIIAKLDAIKAEISNISHRLEFLETQNRPQQQQTGQRRYQW